MSARLVDAPALKAVLSEGRRAYLAVPSRRGPHATPALYGLANGLIGMWVTSTLKARVLRRHGGGGLHTGLLVRTPTAMAVVTGPVQVYDPIRRLAGPSRHLEAMGVTASFVARNAADLAGFARDAPGPAAKRGRIVFGTTQPAEPTQPAQRQHPDRKLFRFDVASEAPGRASSPGPAISAKETAEVRPATGQLGCGSCPACWRRRRGRVPFVSSWPATIWWWPPAPSTLSPPDSSRKPVSPPCT